MGGMVKMTDFTIDCEDRWQVYHRLRELDIDCACQGVKPLKVMLQTPSEVLQLWSIVRRVSAPRNTLVADLKRNWRVPYEG